MRSGEGLRVAGTSTNLARMVILGLRASHVTVLQKMIIFVSDLEICSVGYCASMRSPIKPRDNEAGYCTCHAATLKCSTQSMLSRLHFLRDRTFEHMSIKPTLASLSGKPEIARAAVSTYS